MSNSTNPRVAILMGSDSDLGVMRGAADVLDRFAVPHEVRFLSAHRSPAETVEYVEAAPEISDRAYDHLLAPERGVQAFICGAGMAAHLAGVVAAHTSLPVIGVPLRSESAGLNGVDALYSTVQMPPGIPVATVGIGQAGNAAHLAVRILALADASLATLLAEYRAELADGLVAKNARLDDIGIDAYLADRGDTR
jgi:5-(carboxyamino)imidazole ribonucleotide mutase